MQIAGLAARLCHKQATMTGGAMQCSVLVRRRGIMIRADWVAGAQPQSFKRAVQHPREPPCNFNEAT